MRRELQGFVKASEIVKKSISGNGRFIVEGFASKAVIDRVDDLVEPTAFQKSVERFKQGYALPLLYDHFVPVGKIIDLQITDKGLWVVAEVGEGYEEADKARSMLEQGIVNYFSVGFCIPATGDAVEWKTIEGRNVRVIKEVDLIEISITPIPANSECIFEVDETGKMLKLTLSNKKIEPMEIKKVSGRTDLPLASKDRAWDHDAADARIRKWASVDGSGEKDKMDWKKYASVHFWYNAEDPENFGSYKLLFADVIDGEVKAVPRAIYACAVVLQGGRRGVDIPEDEIEGVKKKVAAYYHKMSEKAPWEQEKSIGVDQIEQVVEGVVKQVLFGSEFKDMLAGVVKCVIGEVIEQKTEEADGQKSVDGDVEIPEEVLDEFKKLYDYIVRDK